MFAAAICHEQRLESAAGDSRDSGSAGVSWLLIQSRPVADAFWCDPPSLTEPVESDSLVLSGSSFF